MGAYNQAEGRRLRGRADVGGRGAGHPAFPVSPRLPSAPRYFTARYVASRRVSGPGLPRRRRGWRVKDRPPSVHPTLCWDSAGGDEGSPLCCAPSSLGACRARSSSCPKRCLVGVEAFAQRAKRSSRRARSIPPAYGMLLGVCRALLLVCEAVPRRCGGVPPCVRSGSSDVKGRCPRRVERFPRAYRSISRASRSS
jgi:hypothetical protein